MTYRILVPLFALFISTPLVAAEVPSLKDLAQRIVDAENKANKTTAEKADSLANLGIAIESFLQTYSRERIRLLDDEIDELAKTPDADGKEILSRIKYEIVKKRFGDWENAKAKEDLLENVQAARQQLEDIAAGFKDVSMGIGEVRTLEVTRLEEVRQEVERAKEAEQRLETEKDKIRDAYGTFVKSLAVIGGDVEAGEKPTDLIEQAKKVIDDFTEKGGLDGITLTRTQADDLKSTLSQIGNIGGVTIDERTRVLEEKIQFAPADYDLWKQWVQQRFTHLQMTGAGHTAHLGVLRILENEIGNRSAIEKELTFLHAYYSGWVNGIFGGDVKDTLAFYETAVAYAPLAEKDRALSRFTELYLMTD